MNDTKFQDKIKAWAFPILLTMISFFLYHFYTQQEQLIIAIEKNGLQQIEQDGKFSLIIFRLNALEKQIETLQNKSF